jgi:threonine dehydrogenase-like Zn-dependent dehydrogenase
VAAAPRRKLRRQRGRQVPAALGRYRLREQQPAQSLRAVRIGGSIAFIGLLGGVSAPVNTYEVVTENVELHGIETGSAQMYQDMTSFIDDRHLTLLSTQSHHSLTSRPPSTDSPPAATSARSC